jgi:ligand-binding sensor domain-containing protein
MEKDGAGNIWFGLHNGKIAKWDNSQRKFFPYKNGVTSTGSILNIFIDRTRNFWVSTEGGFKQFDPIEMAYNNTWLPDKIPQRAFRGKPARG